MLRLPSSPMAGASPQQAPPIAAATAAAVASSVAVHWRQACASTVSSMAPMPKAMAATRKLLGMSSAGSDTIHSLRTYSMAGCSSAPNPQEAQRLTQSVMQSSFREQGIAKLDRLTQDEVQQACSSEQPPPADVVKRLKRIEGQIGGIVRMIEDGRDCSAVVTQLAAASKALSKAGFAVVSTGMRYCSTSEDGKARELDLRELERLFLSLA